MDFRGIMAEGDLDRWLDLAQTIVDRHKVEIMLPPEPCTAMLQAVDSVGCTPFYLGEVLMSEAAVAVNGVAGYGFALEDEPRRALCVAIIDAALAGEVPETAAIRAALADEAARLSAQAKREESLVAATKVNFAIMEG
jgi:alpha-D-ribose 1-methylphosphonate 5-triphosphate synthase subunit PhnG